MKETYVGGDIIETTGGNNLLYAKGNIENSGGQVIQNGKTNGVFYGTNSKWDGPVEIVSLKWLDENDKPIAKKTINTIEYDAFLYGEKVKAEVTFSKDITQEVDLKIKSFFSTKFEENFKIKPQGTKVLTPLFIIPLDIYDDSQEKYQYDQDGADKSHYTYYEKTLIERFTVSVVSEVGAKFFDDEKDTLKPYTYFRNYEELVGVFKESATTAYEDKFIKGNPDIEKLVNEFIDFITNKENIPIEQNIYERINTDAPKLWRYAEEQVQKDNLDDRPLYWARNKMQTYLKRHPVFKDHIDYETSIVKKGTGLENIIKKFEELSRNYTGIDFSKAGSKKKVLITGFDPFQLDSDKEIFNPSGILALGLNGNHDLLKSNIFVQTCILPVRYEDFDNQVIENIIRKHLPNVDMIMTTSLNGDNEFFDVEKYAISYRGGGTDNMNIGYHANEERFIENKKSIYTKTSLPKEKIFGTNKSINIDGFNINYDENKDSNNGSGGNYLSNEIMFRATSVRGITSNKPVGHFHLGYYNDILDSDKMISVTKKIIKRAML
ncbi:hypothetical protein ACVVIH_22060 [Chryseobacterium arthrosphaerae]|uniref:hypothetical protein n=1 Tax=Chryseobacterium arthrosphaerae TaxID=651561 RepID=UPI003D330F56